MLIIALRLFTLLSIGNPGDPVPVSSNARLHLIPDGLITRQLILDCTGCHQFDATATSPNGTGMHRRLANKPAGLDRSGGAAGLVTHGPNYSKEQSFQSV